MITFTKEQLIAAAHARIEFAEMMLAGELEPLKERTWSIELELARIALASLEAKPIGAFHIADQQVGGTTDYIKDGEWPIDDGVIEVYAVPPAPVSVPDQWNKSLQEMVDAMRQYEMDIDEDAPHKHRAMMRRAEELLANRAAMLQGADGKPELTVWYGAMPESNGKTNWTAILHRKGQKPWEGITIDRSEYPDRVRYEADRVRHLIGELADEPDILAYDADAHSGYVKPGNSPVIPDGWKLVPVEPTAEMQSAAASAIRFDTTPINKLWTGNAVYKVMLAAAPQQEVKP